MASTTALFTGLSGLSSNARRLDVIGNNIANVNTTAFKANRMMFAPTFSRTFSLGTGPGELTGGSNPGQIGLGASIAGTQRNFGNGAISSTGVASDVAIEGDGFFIVRNGTSQFFTRAGAFQRNAANNLVTLNGSLVQGYAVDDRFNIVKGNLVDLEIPVGTLTLAEATENVNFSGNLNASGDVATTGSIHQTSVFYTDAGLTTVLASTTYDLTVGGNDLYIDDGTGAGVMAIDGGSGTIITLDGIEKGSKEIEDISFVFSNTAVAGVDTFGQTVADFMTFLDEALGLDNTTSSGQALGGAVSFAGGQIIITGNEGTVQQLAINDTNLVATSVGAGMANPFEMTKTGDADGESVRTSFVVYDSLGTPLTVDLTMVLQATTPGNGTIWEFIAESSENDDIDRVLGIGVLEFDANGKFVSADNDTFGVARGNGAVTPFSVTMLFASGADSISGLTDINSELAAVFQDGSPIGTLSSFSIGEDGVITGSFTNGLTRTIAQVALAKFTNPEGLVDVGNNMFRVGPNSGTALITTPLQFGTGRLVGGALELSNVDLSQEFINMILASTGYSAASRVISTTDELMQQLLRLGA